MKKLVQIVSIILAAISCLSVFVGCFQKDITKGAPDYSQSNGSFDMFGYASPTDGTWTENGETFSTGVDYRTAERYKEYLDAGLNVMLIQGNDPYRGEDFSTSQLKKNMDNCVSAGITKCIVFDSRLQKLSTYTTPIVGEGCLYATQEELNAYVADCMKDYAAHEVFFGVMLIDEPSYTQLDALGSVYQAIKAYKDCYIEANLLPMSDGNEKRYAQEYATMTLEEAYSKYVNDFLDKSQSEKIMMDSYPIRQSDNGYSILSTHIRGLQILADICKKRNVKFEAVAQTFSATDNGSKKFSEPSMPTMQWQMNLYMGFGVQTFGYFTYWRKQANATNGEWFVDNTSFISQYGNKTPLYYTMQELNSQMQSFAPVITQFKYNASSAYIFKPVSYSTGYVGSVENQQFKLIKDISAPTGNVAMVTELYDETKNVYMYMVMNALNPDWKRAENDNLTLEVSVDFGSEYDAALVFYKGQSRFVQLDKGVYNTSLDAGYADYIIPYKTQK